MLLRTLSLWKPVDVVSFPPQFDVSPFFPHDSLPSFPSPCAVSASDLTYTETVFLPSPVPSRRPALSFFSLGSSFRDRISVSCTIARMDRSVEVFSGRWPAISFFHPFFFLV